MKYLGAIIAVLLLVGLASARPGRGGGGRGGGGRRGPKKGPGGRGRMPLCKVTYPSGSTETDCDQSANCPTWASCQLLDRKLPSGVDATQLPTAYGCLPTTTCTQDSDCGEGLGCKSKPARSGDQASEKKCVPTTKPAFNKDNFCTFVKKRPAV